MATGYIKLDRCLLGKHLFNNEKLLKVWIWCLLKARHHPGECTVGLQKINLEAGQFYTGRFNAAQELSLNPTTAWRYLKQLEKNGSINIKSNNKFSVVTVVNWEFYQIDKYPNGQQNEQQKNNKRTANEQQMNTNKNVKNDKNVKKNIYAEFVSMTEEEHNKLVAEYGEETTKQMIETLDNYKGSKGKKYKSDYRAILTWVRDKVLKETKKEKPQQQSYPYQGQLDPEVLALYKNSGD